ncbi:MalY/PatB family protein [Helicovermis profundi]|uniref:cysteine-S-conjugate beta-lyase n=1 Tax=Helicovermis profundi TaxID=3065157 RepID=A0AAU9ESW4_9FIRM|nr:pyridoxal phosphate-dependent aminotransferase [Clostridia bacterium S502]
MDYNFDSIIDRSIYPTEKWSKEKLNKYFGNKDLLSLWVADMDFKTSNLLIDDLVNRARHGIFGYEYKTDDHHNAIINWYKKRHNWSFKQHDLYYAPNILSAISILIDLLTDVGDHIIIQTPVYYPFSKNIKYHKRIPINNSLILVDGKYEIDFDDLEEKAKNSKAKLIILSNPHNPVGRVWKEYELKRIGEICLKYDIKIISDEIHGDIVYKNYKYTPIASISEDIANITMTCLSPGKTFNISGLSTAAVIISNKEIAKKFMRFENKYHINTNNSFSLVAFHSSYAKCGQWFDKFLVYLEDNLLFLKNYIKKNLPIITLIEPEGTYLIWIDLRKLKMKDKQLQKFIIDEVKVAFVFGHWFGNEGSGFIRVNIACPRKILEEALIRLKSAIDQHNVNL